MCTPRATRTQEIVDPVKKTVSFWGKNGVYIICTYNVHVYIYICIGLYVHTISLSLSLLFLCKFLLRCVTCSSFFVAIAWAIPRCCTRFFGQATEPFPSLSEMTWQDMNAKWKEYACTWKKDAGKCTQVNAKWMEHEALLTHLKPTKQLLDPFPSLFRNGFWLDAGSRICGFPQNPDKP